MGAVQIVAPFRRRVPLQARGGDMAVLEFSDSDRPVDILFAHANGFNALAYRTLLAPLGASVRVAAPDLRGHGASTLPARPGSRRGWQDHAEDIAALMDALDGPPLVLAGHSMGATAAILATVLRPRRVARLVLFDPVIWPRAATLVLNMPLASLVSCRSPLVRGALRRRRLFDSREAAMRSWRGRGAYKGWPEAVLADFVADGLTKTAEGYELACSPEWEASNYAAQGHDAWSALRRLEPPVRIVKAEIGSTCSIGPRDLDGVTVEIARGGGHLFPMLQPEVARAALLDAVA